MASRPKMRRLLAAIARLARKEEGPTAHWFNWIERRVGEGLRWSEIFELVEAELQEEFTLEWARVSVFQAGPGNTRERLQVVRSTSRHHERMWSPERRERHREAMRRVAIESWARAPESRREQHRARMRRVHERQHERRTKNAA